MRVSGNSHSDAELVGRVLQKGDSCAYTMLVDRYRAMVCAVAYQWVNSAEDAQDIAQEAFIDVYRNLAELRDPARFAGYLRRAVLNRCADLRRRRREIPLSQHEASKSSLPLEETVLQRLTVQQALSTLSPRIRVTLTLFYGSGYSHGEVAAFLEIPVGTVRSRLRHAKHQLREEMLKMAEETMQREQPGLEWSHQVVEEALRRGAAAMESNRRGDAIHAYDTALTELTGDRDGEGQRLRLDTLRNKATAVRFVRGSTEAIELLREALSLATTIGDDRIQAGILQDLGNVYASAQKAEQSVASYQMALERYRVLGDPSGQAECLTALAMPHLQMGNLVEGRRLFQKALPLFEQANATDWVGVCYALLALLDSRGDEGLSPMLFWRTVCDGLDRDAKGQVRFGNQPGFIVTGNREGHPPALYLGPLFWQMAHLRTLLDPTVSVGETWSGDAFSFSLQPLHATVIVRSNTERVTVPAGTFDNCLLIEQTTEVTQDGPPHGQELNASILCGQRQAWYAPGVGLVRFQVRTATQTEAVVELTHCTIVEDAPGDYLPLATGNFWEYEQTDLPEGYRMTERYRVIGSTLRPNGSARWHLAQWAFAAHSLKPGGDFGQTREYQPEPDRTEPSTAPA